MKRIRRPVCVLFLSLILANTILPVFTGVVNRWTWQLDAGVFSTAEALDNHVTDFSQNVLLSTDDSNYEHHVEVSLAISDGGMLFAGWKNSATHNGGGLRVSFVRSSDGGDTWTQPFDMPMFEGANTRQSDPWLFWSNGTIYYAYLEFESTYLNNPEGPSTFSQVTISKSGDSGGTWTPVKASDNVYFADKETFIVADDGDIFLAYDDVNLIDDDGNTTIRLTRSIDGGDSYDEVSIIDEAETYVGPYITEDSSGNLYVAWTTFDGVGGNLLLSKSLDDGDTFSQPEMINDDGNYSLLTAAQGRPAKSTLPVLRFDETDRLYVLWADVYDQVDHSFDVYLRYSDDFGDSWSPRTQVNPETSGNQWNPEMVIDSTGRIHIAYYDEQGATYRPYYRTVNFTGTDRSTALFSDAIPIANADTLSDFSRPGEYLGLQIDSEMKPHVVWSDARNGEMDIYYAHGLFQEPSSPSMNYELLVAVVVIIALVILVAMCFIKKR